LQYRKLGRWGVKVSAIGLGSWLTYGGSVEEDAARDCILRAYDQGVNFFDTANVYARGRSEEVVGKTLAELPRDSLVIATKVYFRMGQGPNDAGLSRKHVVEQCHHSLRRLGVDYIDLYQCHRYDTDTPLEETCRVMDDLVRQGKILYWGVSEWSADQIAHAVSLCRTNNWAVPASNQPQYSALWRRVERRVLPTCADLGLGNVVWSPLAMGILTGKYASIHDIAEGTRAAGPSADQMKSYFKQEVLDAVQHAKVLASEAGCTVGQLSLAWTLRHRAVSSAIIGATKTSHVDENVAAADLHVDGAVLDAFDELLRPVTAS
jgi:voltage-dependent potassium channel beta subunit